MTRAGRDGTTFVVDLTGLRNLPAATRAALAQARACGREVELLNPSPEVQELLRAAEIDSVLIRGSTAPERSI